MKLTELEDYLRGCFPHPARDVLLDVVQALERSSHALYVVNGCLSEPLSRDKSQAAEPDLFEIP